MCDKHLFHELQPCVYVHTLEKCECDCARAVCKMCVQQVSVCTGSLVSWLTRGLGVQFRPSVLGLCRLHLVSPRSQTGVSPFSGTKIHSQHPELFTTVAEASINNVHGTVPLSHVHHARQRAAWCHRRHHQFIYPGMTHHKNSATHVGHEQRTQGLECSVRHFMRTLSIT